jgi:hypothetical protein
MVSPSFCGEATLHPKAAFATTAATTTPFRGSPSERFLSIESPSELRRARNIASFADGFSKRNTHRSNFTFTCVRVGTLRLPIFSACAPSGLIEQK